MDSTRFDMLILALAYLTACGSAHGAARDPRAATGASSASAASRDAATAQRDSVRGTVRLAGSAPAPVVMLLTKDGRSFRLTSSYPINIVVQLDGLEIVAFGPPRLRPDDSIEMTSFIVRAHGGQPAYDGTLRRGPDGDALELADGRRLTIPRLPEQLTRFDGKRVWIAGPLESPTGAGVIDPDRRFSSPE
jgi:hypothetical protein